MVAGSGLTVVITGANGAVGTALLQSLRQQAPWGAACVRALVRSAAGAQSLQARGVDVRVVDYRQPETLREALAGAEVAIHLAGALLPRRGETLLQANVETTRALVEAATTAGIKTFVYVSFPAADPTSPNQYLSSKGLAEESIRQADFAGVILRVPMILGRQSPAVLQLRRMARAPLLPLISGGTVRLQPIAQDDVLTAITRAMTMAPRPLRVLNLVGPETLSYVALLRQVCERLGTQPKVLPVPRAAAWLSACLAGAVVPGLGWNRSTFDTLFHEHLADSAEACTTLGMTLTPLPATLDHVLFTLA